MASSSRCGAFDAIRLPRKPSRKAVRLKAVRLQPETTWRGIRL